MTTADTKNQKQSIVIVKDDDNFGSELTDYLEKHDFSVELIKSVEDGLEQLALGKPTLIILDQFLGGRDTLSMIAGLRAQFSGGIVFLTGNSELTDRIVALELGADDFISKMTPPRELLARLRSVIRRLPQAAIPVVAAPTEPAGTDAAETGGWRINILRHEVFSPDGSQMHLTSAEFGVLKYLNAHKGQAISRDDLSMAVLHRRFDPWDRSVDNLVSRLRKKIEVLDPGCCAFKTIRGEGYLFIGFNREPMAAA